MPRTPLPLTLPDRPDDQRDAAVAGWAESIVIPTYEPGVPERFPAYLESRVYQGSSGRVYPLPFIESVSHESEPRAWTGLHLENEYVRLMILPELGGRIHVAVDRTTGEDFFYRNDVIKPALVGLAGPWIAGGVEFNWPQHHRPGTFLPMDWTIERDPDGSVTMWCSDHDPFARMKGMHGIRLRPGSALVEARVRLFNRTATTQTFLWWANVAARVHDEYQSFFPTDVHMVADHAKRAVTGFPHADRPYYGIDYAARADPEGPAFVDEDADRLDWYRNITVPTSYMCVGSTGEFFGGYDHRSGVGFVHVADHRIAPGKKQWTWGNAPFGWAWDANLSDDAGPYVELMAGVYTDNQPDFAFLAPGETKTFSQFWYPYQGAGTLQEATTEAGARLQIRTDAAGPTADVAVIVTRPRHGVAVELHDGEGSLVWSTRADIAPGSPLTTAVPVPDVVGLHLTVTADGTRLLSVSTTSPSDAAEIDTATEPPAPAEIATVEELYLTGLHLAQYRHATRSPEPYWREALSRDPGHSRSHIAVASRRLADGRLDEAEAHLRTAVARLTGRNPNPADGSAHYLLGVVLVAQGRDAEADAAFGKSLWNAAWRTPSLLALSRIAARADDWHAALDRAKDVLRTDGEHLQAAAIAVCALRALGDPAQAGEILARVRAIEPLDAWLSDLGGAAPRSDAGILRDVAEEYRSLGLVQDALRVLAEAAAAAVERPVPGAGDPLALIHYRRAELLESLGETAAAEDALLAARTVSADRCFAADLSDARLLADRAARDGDPRAHALLGHWLYFRGRHDEAVAELEAAVAADPTDVVSLRGLGLAAYNVQRDPEAAAHWYARALEISPHEPKLRYEADQLARRRGVAPAQRLSDLDTARDAVAARDDLSLAYAELLVLVGRHEEAIRFLSERRFSPWEGGEGEAIRVWSLAQKATAEAASADGRHGDAVRALEAALEPPATLGEARHPLANLSDVLLALGDALSADGRDEDARTAWRSAASSVGDFTSMLTVPYSPATYFSVLAARRLGDDDTARRLTEGLAAFIGSERHRTPSIDYFATSLPSMLIFREDIEATHRDHVRLLEAQLALLQGRADDAAAILDRLSESDPSDAVVLSLLRDCRALSRA